MNVDGNQIEQVNDNCMRQTFEAGLTRFTNDKKRSTSGVLTRCYANHITTLLKTNTIAHTTSGPIARSFRHFVNKRAFRVLESVAAGEVLIVPVNKYVPQIQELVCHGLSPPPDYLRVAYQEDFFDILMAIRPIARSFGIRQTYRHVCESWAGVPRSVVQDFINVCDNGETTTVRHNNNPVMAGDGTLLTKHGIEVACPLRSIGCKFKYSDNGGDLALNHEKLTAADLRDIRRSTSNLEEVNLATDLDNCASQSHHEQLLSLLSKQQTMIDGVRAENSLLKQKMDTITSALVRSGVIVIVDGNGQIGEETNDVDAQSADEMPVNVACGGGTVACRMEDEHAVVDEEQQINNFDGKGDITVSVLDRTRENVGHLLCNFVPIVEQFEEVE